MPGNGGLDIDLTTAIVQSVGATAEFIPYEGADFNGDFDAIGSVYDCVTAVATVTPERETKAQFVPSYLISGQSLGAESARRRPPVRATPS
jgi:ABC-type amino acid transport substrate-binding protein